MPKPKPIKLDELDLVVKQAVRNFSGGKLPGTIGPIINGIILNETALGAHRPLSIAKEVVKSISVPEGVTLKPTAKPFGDGKILVGFVVNIPRAGDLGASIQTP